MPNITKEYAANKVIDLAEMIKNPNHDSLEIYKTMSNIINVRANDPDKNKVWNRRIRAMGYINNCSAKINVSNLEYSGVTYQRDLLTTLNEQLEEAKKFVSAAKHKPTFHGNERLKHIKNAETLINSINDMMGVKINDQISQNNGPAS